MNAAQPTSKHPTLIARETLKRLASQRIAPTPDHYEAIYYQIAGSPSPKYRSHPLIDALLEALRGLSLPTEAVELAEINSALARQNWPTAAKLLTQHVEAPADKRLAPPWGELLLQILAQTFKDPAELPLWRAAVADKVQRFAQDPQQLYDELRALITQWHELVGTAPRPTIENSRLSVDVSATLRPSAGLSSTDSEPIWLESWQCWREMLLATLRDGLMPRLSMHPQWHREIEFICEALEGIQPNDDMTWLQKRLRQSWLHMALRVDQEQRLIDALLKLLMLLLQHWLPDSSTDPWLQHQLNNVRNSLLPPLTLHAIYDAEVLLKEVLYQQGVLGHSLHEAQQSFKAMIDLFLERLGIVSEATGSYQQKIAYYREQVSHTHQTPELKALVENLMEDTRHMQLDMLRSRDELLKSQQEVAATQQRVDKLRQQLRQVSEQNRDDRLTGALSHRVLVDTFQSEQEKMQQSGEPLCLALLDVDNLAELNTQLGHSAADDTLTHLVQVIKTVMRDGDSVIRYGAEEFLILLPNTTLSAATELLRRLQRELTKRFFMNNNKRLLVTFNAGVTPCFAHENREQVLDRADYAVFQAKKQGKNQVVVLSGDSVQG